MNMTTLSPPPSIQAKAMRILIVDDHQLVRSGLKVLMLERDRACEIGEAESGAEALQMVLDAPWDIVLLDISMPGMSGVDTLKEIKKARPGLPVLILSMYAEDQYAVNLLRAGAGGYISKEAPSAQLYNAIVTVASGHRYVSAELAEHLAQILTDETATPSHTLLSEREFQVFCKLAAGRTVTGISSDLQLSVKTVSTYRTRALEKMKMHSNAELTSYATKNGLLR